MNLFSLLSLLSFTVYIYLGLYAFKQDSLSTLNRIFLVLCFDLAWWAFSYAFVYSAPDKEVLWFWFKLSAVGWCLVGGISLHLALILTQKDRLLRKWWIYPVLYLPGLIILGQAWKGIVTAKDFVRTPLGWVEVWAVDSIWLWIHTLNYSTCLLVGIFLIFRWGSRSHIPLHKKQSRIIISTVALSFGLGTLINIIFPVLQLQVLPAIAPIIILIWAYGIRQAIVKYRLMVLTPAIAKDEIISQMKDLLILTNHEGKIVKINRQAEKTLGYRETELIRQPIGIICRDEEVVQEIFLRITGNRFPLPDREVEYQTKNGELIPVKISCSIIKDKLGDPMGMVVIAEDRRTTLRLKDEIMVRRRAEDALLKVHADLEGLIQQRTKELYRVNESLQAEMAEREEMERLFRTLFMQSPIGTYLAQQGKIKMANPEFTNVTGFREKELMAVSSLSLVHPEDREEVTKNTFQMLQGERHHPYEFRIMTRDGHIRWILETVTSIRYQGLPATLASFMDITNRKESEEMIRQLAYKDSLTGLPNRVLFLDRLAFALVQAERHKKNLTLMMLDLDNFKEVNDEFGHHQGDLVLKEVGRRLIGFLRKSDTVARMGGDEFMILLSEVDPERDAEKIAGKILEIMQRPFQLETQSVQVTASIGMAFYPKDGLSAEGLMKNADQAMYRAKEQGRNNFQIFGLKAS